MKTIIIIIIIIIICWTKDIPFEVNWNWLQTVNLNRETESF